MLDKGVNVHPYYSAIHVVIMDSQSHIYLQWIHGVIFSYNGVTEPDLVIVYKVTFS